MAIYHLHVGHIGGIKAGKSQSAVGFAAYISGEKIESERTGVVYDFRKKAVEESRIFLPQNAPERFLNRADLWNEVEKIEGANARYAKTIDAAIPNELSLEECRNVMADFGDFFTKRGIICDMALHLTPKNHHIHLMLTTRGIDAEGNWQKYKEKKVYALDEEGKKIPVLDNAGEQKIDSRGRLVWKRIRVVDNVWNKKEFLLEIRQEWERICNSALERQGIENRIDCRSYKEQGIERIPTKHEGRAARELEARGGTSDVCQENRIIRQINFLREMKDAVSTGIDILKGKIKIVREEIQQEYKEFLEAFKLITSKAADVISLNNNPDVLEMNPENDFVGDDIDNVARSEIDPLDQEEFWHDPV